MERIARLPLGVKRTCLLASVPDWRRLIVRLVADDDGLGLDAERSP